MAVAAACPFPGKPVIPVFGVELSIADQLFDSSFQLLKVFALFFDPFVIFFELGGVNDVQESNSRNSSSTSDT